MTSKRLFWMKLGLFILLIGFGLFALLYPNLPEQKLDTSVLFLITLAILVVILPWERLSSFRAAGVELVLDNPQVNKALNDLKALKDKERINDEKLWSQLRQLESEIELARGSRILWIDDTPDNVLGERRLFRALDIETVMAVSSEMAKSILETDGDFDLIISDMRSGENSKQGDKGLPEAVRFIQQVRAAEVKRSQLDRYKHIPSVPVVFYSGKKYAELLYLTQSVRGPKSILHLASGVEMLLTKILETLAYVRSEPIQIVVGSTPGEIRDPK